MKKHTRHRIAALALSAALLGMLSLPAAAQSGFATMTRGSELKMLMAREEDEGFHLWESRDVWAEAERSHTPNTATPLSTLSPAGVTRLSLSVVTAGLVLEPSETGSFELELVGVAKAEDIKTSLTVKDGVLFLAVEGGPGVRYICAEPGGQVNVARLKVPPRDFTLVECAADTAVVLLPELGAPVKGTCAKGILAVDGDTVASACALETENGLVMVRGKEIAGAMTLKAENGMVTLTGGTVTGPLAMSAENGMVNVSAERLAGLTAETKNGMIKIEAGRLTGDVSAVTGNGMVKVNLLEQPANLALAMTSASNGTVKLPDGWRADSRFGSGKPQLELACKNGRVSLAIGPDQDGEKDKDFD